jgi:hypothetical protein
MREISAPAHFLLLLKPGVTKIDFIAVADADQSHLVSLDECRGVLDQAYEELLAGIKRERAVDLSNTEFLFALCRRLVTVAKQLGPHLKLDEQLVRAVAVRWLEEESLSLGDAFSLPAWNGERWRSSPNQQAPLRFQDAIDWYAGHHCSVERAKFAREAGYSEVGATRSNPTILRVPMSASRPNIVTLGNLKTFLAEHLLAYDQYASSVSPAQNVNESSGLTFFFLPIKGLGQFRAAIDWVGVDGYKMNSLKIEHQLMEQASTLQRLGLESLFTQSLIQSFSTSLRQAFSEMQEEESASSSGALYQAFADLWWASEVRFYKDGHLQNRLLRAEGENDVTWHSSTASQPRWNLPWTIYDGTCRGFLTTSGNGHPDLTYIRLKLSSFAQPSNDTNRKLRRALSNALLGFRDLEKTIGELPFDEVYFACYFFEPVEEDLAEWVDQLGEAVVTVLLEQTIQRTKIVRSRAKTVERLAHWLNGLMRSVGRARAANNLQQAAVLVSDDDTASQLLKEVGNSLQLMVLAEAGTSLFRLYGTIDEGDFGHLRKWFTETSRLEWGKTSAFEKYRNSIAHLARAIGGARGHKRIDIVVQGTKTEYTTGCELDLDELRFPPLAKGEKVNEPILALLPALTEPLENALNYLDKRQQLGSETPIRIEIEDLRQTESPCILVNIGNRFFADDELPERHGLARAQQLMEITELATISEGEKRDVEGVPYYFVPVRLHPQRLAEAIDRQYEIDDEGCLCL